MEEDTRCNRKDDCTLCSMLPVSGNRRRKAEAKSQITVRSGESGLYSKTSEPIVSSLDNSPIHHGRKSWVQMA